MRVKLFNLPAFKLWLTSEGAVFAAQSPNPYEVLRYVGGASNKLGLAYRNDKDQSVALSGQAIIDWRRFLAAQQPGAAPTPRPHQRRRNQLQRRLAARDGSRCFFCHDPDQPLTIEHLCSRLAGGPNHIDNLCLACEPCNQALGARPVAEKLAYYHSLHGARTARLRQKGYEDA